ncbi:MAG: hypothetical protein RX316_02325 [bacterium]|nr:hypothetical protein [bacterium]
MLPDFPASKRKYKDWADELVRLIFKVEAPVIALLKKVKQHEGKLFAYERERGEMIEPSYTTATSEIEVHISEAPNMTPEKLIEKLKAVAKDLAKQQEEPLFETLTSLSEESGTVVKGSGEPLNPDLLIEVLEKLDIDFDHKTGQPRMPTIVVSPQLNIEEKLKEWEADKKAKIKYQTLIEKKRQEWRDRESNRKLVD